MSWHEERGICWKYANFVACPVHSCFLCPLSHSFNPMRPIIFQIHYHGNYYAGDHIDIHDHSKSITINGANTNVSDLVRSLMSDDIEDVTPENTPSTTTPKFFCVSPKFSEQNIRDRIAAELNQSTTKIDFCRALYRLQHIGCIDIDQYSSDDRRAKALNDYQSTYKLSASDFCKARATRWTQNDAEFSQS